MKKKKYPFILFISGFFMNVFVRYFWVLVAAVLFLLAGIFINWRLYVGIGLLALDIVLSLIGQLQIRRTMLSESDNEDFGELQDAVSADGNVLENVRRLVEEKAAKYEDDGADALRYSQANEAVNKLKNTIKKGMPLPEIVDCFEKMCETAIDDDSVLFETEIFKFTGEKLFYFTLNRQIPNGNGEYYQIGIHVQYKATKENKGLCQSVWSDCIDGSIFDYIRNSDVYKYCNGNEYIDTVIYIDET